MLHPRFGIGSGRNGGRFMRNTDQGGGGGDEPYIDPRVDDYDPSHSDAEALTGMRGDNVHLEHGAEFSPGTLAVRKDGEGGPLIVRSTRGEADEQGGRVTVSDLTGRDISVVNREELDEFTPSRDNDDTPSFTVDYHGEAVYEDEDEYDEDGYAPAPYAWYSGGRDDRHAVSGFMADPGDPDSPRRLREDEYGDFYDPEDPADDLAEPVFPGLPGFDWSETEYAAEALRQEHQYRRGVLDPGGITVPDAQLQAEVRMINRAQRERQMRERGNR